MDNFDFNESAYIVRQPEDGEVENTGMDNFDFNESAYIVRQPEATDNAVFAPATERPFTGTDLATENGETRPAPVISDDGNADKTHENGEMRPEPRRKHPHRGNKGDRMGGDRKSDGTERDGRRHLNRGDGSAPNGGHRPVPLPYFPDGEEQNRPQVRPAPYNDGNDAATYAPDVLTDSTARPLPDGGLGDKIVPRALTDAESAATAVALNNQSVAGARAIETADGVLVAVLLDPVFLASERRGLKETLRAEIENATGACAVVTYDLGVYRNIRPDMTDEAKAALYAAVTARN